MRLVFFAFLIVVAWPFALDLAMSPDRLAPGGPRLRDKVISYISWARVDPQAVVAATVDQDRQDACTLSDDIQYSLPPTRRHPHYMVVRGPVLTV